MLPELINMYSPKELERRRLQNWAEEQIADQEARLQREDPAVPEEDDFIARCMRLWSAKPELKPETNSKKRAYENLSDDSTQDGKSVGEPESPTRDEVADYGANEKEIVDHDKPTQSDCISIDYSPYTTAEPRLKGWRYAGPIRREQLMGRPIWWKQPRPEKRCATLHSE